VRDLIENLKSEEQKIIQAQSDASTAGDQVKELGRHVQGLIDKYNSIGKALGDRGALPQDAAKPIEQTVNTSAVAGDKGTAYFQFAGGFTRQQAQAISAEIQKLGWNIPGEDRTPLAVGTNKIRFSPSSPADRQKAANLRDDVNGLPQAQRSING
jgi:hypothetical protein